ncbi:MAG: hypothetical protein WAM69_14430 [Candidatus Sulfotelmatobacter sp.]
MITKGRFSCMFFLLLAACAITCLFSAMPAQAQNVQVDLSSTSALCGGQECFNVAGLFTTGTTFLGTNGMDDGNNCTPTAPYTNCPDAYSSNQLGLSSTTPPTLTPPSLGVPFTFGPVNTANCGSTGTACIPDVVNLTTAGVVITLPADQQSIYSTLIMLGNAVNGPHAGQVTATYTTGAPQVFSQTFSDWCSFGDFPYESIAVSNIKRINSDGTLNGASCNLYAYTYPLDFTRTLQSITLTDEDNSGFMFGLAITLKPPSYTLAGGPPTPTSITPGTSSTATIAVNPQPGYQGTVTLSCSISPAIATAAATAPTCTLSPTSVTVTTGETSPPTTTMTFTSAPPPTQSMSRRASRRFYALWLPLPGLALLGLSLGSRRSRRKRLLGLLLFGFLLAGIAVTPACVSETHLGNVGTPPGMYTLTVTGVDTNGLSQAGNPATVTVTVADTSN